MVIPLLLVCIGLIHVAQVRSECPDGWLYYEQSCYYFGRQGRTFLDAEQECSTMKSHLVAIETAEEGAFIKSFVSELKHQNHWLGLTDEIIDGIWVWYGTNSTVTFTDWDEGQPNNGQHSNCAAIFASHNYRWVDEPCTKTYASICEISVETYGSEIVGK